MKEFVLIKKNKGQALLEFVLLIPVITAIIFTIIDVSNFFYHKTHLEGVLNDVCLMVKENKTKTEIEKLINDDTITYQVLYDNGYATITLNQKINFTTPINASLFKKIANIEAKRTIIYE